MAVLTRETITDWLKSQSAAERSFARALRRFFIDQAARVADAARGIDLTPGMVPLIFHADNEHARLKPMVRRNIAGMMVAGAKAELAAFERRRNRRKSIDEISPYDPEYAERFGLDASDL